MQFTRLDNAVAVCKKHLEDTGTQNTEIESYLVGYLLISISSEFECIIEAMVNQRAARAGDGHLSSFVRAAADRIIRSVKIDELSGLLNHFDPSCKKQFIDDPQKQAKQVGYGNIVLNRHSVAHATGTSMTFGELEIAYQDSKELMDCFGKCLGLTQDEIDNLTW